MPSVKPITTDTPWYRLEVGEEDWKTEDAVLLVRLYEQLLLIRRYEEKLLELHGLGLIHGPAHVSIGQGRFHLCGERIRFCQRDIDALDHRRSPA